MPVGCGGEQDPAGGDVGAGDKYWYRKDSYHCLKIICSHLKLAAGSCRWVAVACSSSWRAVTPRRSPCTASTQPWARQDAANSCKFGGNSTFSNCQKGFLAAGAPPARTHRPGRTSQSPACPATRLSIATVKCLDGCDGLHCCEVSRAQSMHRQHAAVAETGCGKILLQQLALISRRALRC